MNVVDEAVASHSYEARRNVLIGNEGTHYELLFPIGAGGMASVYLARRRIVNQAYRLVAVKVLHPHLITEEASQLDAFMREAQIAARLQHPNIVSVTDVGMRDDGVPFLVMDYVEGESLSGLLRKLFEQKRRMPLSEAGRILLDMLAGLRAAHELAGWDGQRERVVHRDVSPQNILVGVDGTTRLADFGIAKAVSTLNLTITGTVKGKPGYMAPEQIRGEKPNQRWDVWSAGVVAWETFATQRIFPVGDESSVVKSILDGSVQRLSERCPWVPEPVSQAVAGALMAAPANRYGTVAEFRDHLLDALNATVGIADAAQVAALTNELAGETIRERREKVRSFSAAPLEFFSDDASSLSTEILKSSNFPLAENNEPASPPSQKTLRVATSREPPTSVGSTNAGPTGRTRLPRSRLVSAIASGMAFALIVASSWLVLRTTTMHQHGGRGRAHADASATKNETVSHRQEFSARGHHEGPFVVHANLPIAAVQLRGKVTRLVPARSSVVLTPEQLGDADTVTLIAQSGDRVSIDIHGTKDAFVSFPVREHSSSPGTTLKGKSLHGNVRRHPSTLQLAPTPYSSGIQQR